MPACRNATLRRAGTAGRGVSIGDPKKVLETNSRIFLCKFLNPAVAETAMGKPPFKASDGGLIDRLRELEEITQSDFQQGSGT